jgi:hypothetical protein
MRNLHLIQTKRLSRIGKYIDTGNLVLRHDNDIPRGENFELYITDDSVIKYNEYYLGEDNNIYCLVTTVNYNGKKIIMTTDQDLIEHGIQPINDKFLEWFVKNPNCEKVKVELFPKFCNEVYGIIIPKEEPKITNCGNKNCQSGVINGKNPKICRKCNPSEQHKKETWEEIEEEYYKDQYPIFGGPFTDALRPFEWLKLWYNPPIRK